MICTHVPCSIYFNGIIEWFEFLVLKFVGFVYRCLVFGVEFYAFRFNFVRFSGLCMKLDDFARGYIW